MKVLWDEEHRTKIVKMVIDILNKGKKTNIDFLVTVSEPAKIVISYNLFIPATQLAVGVSFIPKTKIISTDIWYSNIAGYIFDWNTDKLNDLPKTYGGDPILDLNNLTPEQEISLGKCIMQYIWNDVKPYL